MRKKFKRLLLTLFVLISSVGISLGEDRWQDITSVDQLCQNYPDLMKGMISKFNLNYPGLEEAKKANEEGDIKQVCEEILDYYKSNDNFSHLRRDVPVEGDQTVALADTILNNVFTLQAVKGKVLYGEDGHRDWFYRGPNNDREWAWLSNRHEQLENVFDAYFKTGNPKYATYIDLFLRDFIIKSLPYPAKKSWDSIWRGLEISFRGKRWSTFFYGLINNDLISPATKLLMLSSLPDHADYNRKFHAGGNWLTMEISALAVVAATFPEYKESDEWLEYAMEQMTESIKEQVYLDGVQNELASHYHHVALVNFETFKNICELADKRVPDTFTNTLEAMYEYLVKSIRPDGFGALNNDSDKNFNRDTLMRAADIFNRPDWKYIVSNKVAGSGEDVKDISFFFSWAGQLISRSDLDSDAHWSLFDIGPWGAGHEHNDKLHISISAFGRDLLVDSGRFAYTGEIAKKFRSYATGTVSHNTVLVDGKGQTSDTPLLEKPIGVDQYKITERFDFATGSFDSYIGVEGTIKHNRSLFYVRGDFWVVVDRVITDRPRTIETMWRWHPDCEVVKGDDMVVRSNNEYGNLTIIPVTEHSFDIDFVKGQETPAPQGWYSPEYNVFMPNTVSTYKSNIESSTTYVWILQPSKSATSSMVKAKIISESDEGVVVKVKSQKGSYKIIVPFFNSKEAALN